MELKNEVLETVTLTVDQFCASNQFSRVHFYELLKGGLGPRIMKLGRRTLITKHAETEWHRRMESVTQGGA